MASIVKRRNKYCVIYRFKDQHGVTHQKWETVATEKAAIKRKEEVENRGFEDLFSVATIKTVHDLVME